VWPELEGRYPVRAMALPSAVVSLALGFFLGLRGFLAYAGQTADSTVRATEEMGASIGLSALSIFAFVLLTPLGWLSAYLFAAGLLRVFLSVTGDVGGDPLLSLVDGVLHRRSVRKGFVRASADRGRREGPEVADVLMRGGDAGWLEAEWVVVASRLKPGWEKGVTVVTPGRWFRLGERADRHTPEGLLRAYYPLYAMGGAEVIRRSVGYEHPGLEAAAVEDPGPMRDAKH
jgi:hypothetical protein